MSNFNHFIAHINTVEMGEMHLDCTPDNTILFLHHPDKHKEYDHFFRTLSDDERPEEYRGSHRNLGAFITRHTIGDEEFEHLANAVSESCNYKVVYNPEPTPQDKQSIDEQMQAILHRELKDIEPEDFQ